MNSPKQKIKCQTTVNRCDFHWAPIGDFGRNGIAFGTVPLCRQFFDCYYCIISAIKILWMNLWWGQMGHTVDVTYAKINKQQLCEKRTNARNNLRWTISVHSSRVRLKIARNNWKIDSFHSPRTVCDNWKANIRKYVPPQMPMFNCFLSRFSMKSPRKRFIKSVTMLSNTISPSFSLSQ